MHDRDRKRQEGQQRGKAHPDTESQGIDKDYGNGHEQHAHPAPEAEHHDKEHREQGQHKFIRYSSGIADKRHNRMQSSKDVYYPAVFGNYHNNWREGNDYSSKCNRSSRNPCNSSSRYSLQIYLCVYLPIDTR